MPFTIRDCRFITSINNQRIREWYEVLMDTDRTSRLEQGLCRICFYIGTNKDKEKKINENDPPLICDYCTVTIRDFHTPGDILCSKCGKALYVCPICGSSLDEKIKIRFSLRK